MKSTLSATDKRLRLGDWLSKNKKFSITLIGLLMIGIIWATVAISLNIEKNVEAEDIRVRINEIMTENRGAVKTESGESPGWIEIYNYGTNDIYLSSLRFSDDTQHEFDEFPDILLCAGEYITIFFTDKNVQFSDSEPNVNFNIPTSGSDIYLSDVFGQIIEVINVPDIEENTSWGVVDENSEIDYAFFSSPSPNEYNSGAFFENSQEAKNAEYEIEISEYCINSKISIYSVENDFEYIEIYNPSDEIIELRGCYLTDVIEKEKFVFSTQEILPGEYLIVKLGKSSLEVSNTDLYTGFEISDNDDGIFLYAPNGKVIDSMPIVTHTYGYAVVNEGLDVKFAVASPGSENGELFDTADNAAMREYKGVIINEVMAVHGEGGYDWIELYNSGNYDISIMGWILSDGQNEGYVLPEYIISPGEFYVLECKNGFGLSKYGETLSLYDSNGNIQDCFESGKQRIGISSGRNSNGERVYYKKVTKGKENGSKYYIGYSAKPIITNQNLYVESGESIIITCENDCEIRYTTDGTEPTSKSAVYTEPIKITSGCVLRAKAYPIGENKDFMIESDQVSATYIILDEYSKHSLPVISVSGSDRKLFGPYGAFTLYDDDIRVTVRFEYYDINGCKIVDSDTVLRIAGHTSREYDQKSFSLNFSERIGDASVSGVFFRDTDLTEYPNLLLRSCGQEWNKSKLRDEFVARALKNAICSPIQSAEPCAVYINGEYYGLYYLREKRNEKFIASYTGAVADDIHIQESVYFKTSDYKKIEKFAMSQNMKVESNYEYMKERVDFDSLIDFWIAQSFFLNPDTHNVCRWREADGKWNFIVYDMDWALYDKYNINYISRMYSGVDNDREGYLGAVYCPLMTSLLKNPEFEEMFIKRYCELLATDLKTERLMAILNEMESEIEDEIGNQQKRWGVPSAKTWRSHVDDMKQLLLSRSDVIIKQLAKSSSYSEKELRDFIKSYA